MSAPAVPTYCPIETRHDKFYKSAVVSGFKFLFSGISTVTFRGTNTCDARKHSTWGKGVRWGGGGGGLSPMLYINTRVLVGNYFEKNP